MFKFFYRLPTLAVSSFALLSALLPVSANAQTPVVDSAVLDKLTDIEDALHFQDSHISQAISEQIQGGLYYQQNGEWHSYGDYLCTKARLAEKQGDAVTNLLSSAFNSNPENTTSIRTSVGTGTGPTSYYFKTARPKGLVYYFPQANNSRSYFNDFMSYTLGQFYDPRSNNTFDGLFRMYTQGSSSSDNTMRFHFFTYWLAEAQRRSLSTNQAVLNAVSAIKDNTSSLVNEISTQSSIIETNSFQLASALSKLDEIILKLSPNESVDTSSDEVNNNDERDFVDTSVALSEVPYDDTIYDSPTNTDHFAGIGNPSLLDLPDPTSKLNDLSTSVQNLPQNDEIVFWDGQSGTSADSLGKVSVRLGEQGMVQTSGNVFVFAWNLLYAIFSGIAVWKFVLSVHPTHAQMQGKLF